MPGPVCRSTLLCGLLVLTGCSTVPEANFWQRTEGAAVHAARSPWVWAPIAGAALMQIDNWDHRVSDSAIRNTPVFGSVSHAETASDNLMLAAGAGYLASTLATPAEGTGGDWWSAKIDDGLVGLGAIAATSVVTGGLKAVTGRERPNGNGNKSFPSGHTSFAAVADTMTVRNLAVTPMNGGVRTALMIGADALTFATGWARVEAGKHYPSDVLFGMAIGNFFGAMFDEAFLADRSGEQLSLTVDPLRGGGEIAWNWRF